MKRILTIQDISCLGKCSLTIALPVLSAMGVETAILPTALLSTHTMFQGAVVTDLSDRMLPVIHHWEKEGIRFDAIYTGYLGSTAEIDMVIQSAAQLSTPETFLLVDPVMGDHGVLYRGFDDAYVEKTRELCAIADLILPNLTEASLLTGAPWQEDCTQENAKQLLASLAALGPEKTVLTGISLQPDMTGAMGYDRTAGRFFSCQVPVVPAVCHGTGDLFASVTAGALLNGLNLEASVSLAARYTARTIEATLQEGRDRRFGLSFEKTLPELMTWLEEEKSNTLF